MQTLQLSWPVQSIERAVAALWPGLAAEVLTQVDSTNTLLLERARAGLVQPALVVADPTTCSFQFDPVGVRKFTNSCEDRKSVV